LRSPRGAWGGSTNKQKNRQSRDSGFGDFGQGARTVPCLQVRKLALWRFKQVEKICVKIKAHLFVFT